MYMIWIEGMLINPEQITHITAEDGAPLSIESLEEEHKDRSYLMHFTSGDSAVISGDGFRGLCGFHCYGEWITVYGTIEPSE